VSFSHRVYLFIRVSALDNTLSWICNIVIGGCWVILGTILSSIFSCISNIHGVLWISEILELWSPNIPDFLSMHRRESLWNHPDSWLSNTSVSISHQDVLLIELLDLYHSFPFAFLPLLFLSFTDVPTCCMALHFLNSISYPSPKTINRLHNSLVLHVIFGRWIFHLASIRCFIWVFNFLDNFWGRFLPLLFVCLIILSLTLFDLLSHSHYDVPSSK